MRYDLRSVVSLQTRAVKSFLDVLVLEKLVDSPMSAYDAIAYIHDEYKVLVN